MRKILKILLLFMKIAINFVENTFGTDVGNDLCLTKFLE